MCPHEYFPLYRVLISGLALVISFNHGTVCPVSSDPPEKILNIFASENAIYTIFQLLRYFRLNIIRLQSKIF